MKAKKTILITGVSRGLGKALLIEALKDENYNVIGISRDIEGLRKEFLTQTNQPLLIKHDISDLKADFSSIYASLNEKYGRIDYLINNAASINVKPFVNFSIKEIENLYTTNVFSHLVFIQHLLPLMENGVENAHIVNIGSMGGYQGSVKFPGLSIYASTKAALANLSEGLAVEFSEKKVSINCLAIGSVRTEMLRSAFPEYEGGVSPKEMASYIINFTLHAWKVFNGKVIPVSNSTP